MLRRVMGKATFITIQDVSGQIQLYVARDNLPEGEYQNLISLLDLGDIVGAKGTLFKTKTGELTVRASDFQLLTKSPSSIAKQTYRLNRPRNPLPPTFI